MRATIDSKLIAILFLMNEINRLKNNIEEASLPIATEDENVIKTVISEIEIKYDLAFDCVQSKNDALEYEQALSNYVSYILNEESENIYNEDEIHLMKKSKSINNTSLKEYDFNFSDHITDVLSGVKISSTGISDWLKNPDFIELFESNEVENYLCTKRVKLFNRAEYIIFYHATKKDKSQQKELDLHSLFFIHYKNYSDMLSNPIRLFLFLLDNYGLEIECEGKVSRFVIEANSEQLKMNLPANTLSYGQMQGKHIFNYDKKEMSNLIIFSYGIDLNKYLSDFNNNMI
jgi:hypothetical protein